MKRKSIHIAVLLFAISRLAALAGDYTFQLVAAPGYTHSRGYGINNSGAIVLGVGSAEASFHRDSSGTFTQILYSGHTPTVAFGINNLGVIVGDAYNPPTDSYIGFIRAADGTFSNFSYPGAFGPDKGMQANDINDSGTVVGGYVVNSSDSGAFIRLSDGQFKTFRFMDNPDTSAYGINNAGEITGQIFDGIAGQVSHQSSFLRYADGTFVSIAVPGASETQAFGINDSGQVVGLYFDNGAHGFVRDGNGTFSSFDVPGAESTQPCSINDSGQISGFALVNGRNYAFIATPVPEPSTLALLAIGGVAIGFIGRRKETT
jgi:uncharacterized membrane protein